MSDEIAFAEPNFFCASSVAAGACAPQQHTSDVSMHQSLTSRLMLTSNVFLLRLGSSRGVFLLDDDRSMSERSSLLSPSDQPLLLLLFDHGDVIVDE